MGDPAIDPGNSGNKSADYYGRRVCLIKLTERIGVIC